jgi:hypothetical protein
LDRFGLPQHPTEESVFPPLSSDVVRVPIIISDSSSSSSNNGLFNRSQILEATKSRYLGVNLHAFNDTGHSTFHHHSHQHYCYNDTSNSITVDDDDDDEEEDANNDINNIWSLQMRHVDPPIFTIDNFLSSVECDYLSSLLDDEDANNDNTLYVVDPPIFTVDNFLSSVECDYLSSLIKDENDNNNNTLYVVVQLQNIVDIVERGHE